MRTRIYKELIELNRSAYELWLFFAQHEKHDASFIKEKHRQFTDKINKFLQILPENIFPQSLNSHLYYLSKDVSKSEFQIDNNIKSVCEDDLVELEKNINNYYLKKYFNNSKELQSALLNGVSTGLAHKSSLFLTEKLRKDYQIDSSTDGTELVNSIFGKNGKNTSLSPDKKEGWRNLLTGMYGVFRNTYFHNNNDIEPENAEVYAMFVGMLINEIDKIEK